MKLILAGDPGTYSNTDYAPFIQSCKGGWCKGYPYKVPVPSLDAVQLYVFFGSLKPVAYTAEIVSTCGGGVATLTTENYIIGQRPDLRYYGVFRKFVVDPDFVPSCFVISIVFTFADASEKRYFSEEICVENCLVLTEIKSCYPDGVSTLSFDCTNIYFGFHAGDPLEALGNLSIRYYHRIFVRSGIVLNTSHKLTFKTYLTRNFRTEQQKIWEMRCELLPEWYKEYFTAVIARGVVSIRETQNSDLVKYTLNESLFELIEEDYKLWKTTASLIEICRQYFGCDEGACIPPCLQPPTDLAMAGPDGSVYTFTFSGGVFTTGDTIEWMVRRKDTGALVQNGTIIAFPLQFTIDGVATGFDPATYCYTFSWRKACNNTTGSFSDDFEDSFETASGLSWSPYTSKEIGVCGSVDAPPCKRYVFGVVTDDDAVWSLDAVLCDGTPYSNTGTGAGGPPDPICAQEGTVVPTGNLTITDSSGECGTGHKDEDEAQYTVVEGPVEGVCEMTAQLTRTPEATADSITNGHRIKVTVKFTGDQAPTPFVTTLDFIFEIGDAYSNILTAHVHAGGGDYCTHIDTLITAVVVIP